MSARDDAIRERQARALDDVKENGPGLRWSMVDNIYVVAKDPETGFVKLGGLGALGVGQMWSINPVICEGIRDDPTYADAPEEPYPGESFG